MLKFVMLGFIIAALLGFIIWKPWKDLKAVRQLGISFWSNPKIMIINIIKLLLIPALIVFVIILYFIFVGDHEHVYIETIIKEATCEEKGILRHQCRYCDKKYEEEILLLDHKYGETSRSDPTCTKSGAIVYTCKGCGKTATEEIKALGHKWSEWHITKDAKILSKGEKKRTCAVCGELERGISLHPISVTLMAAYVLLIAGTILAPIIIRIIPIRFQSRWLMRNSKLIRAGGMGMLTGTATVVICILFYKIFIAESKPETPKPDEKLQKTQEHLVAIRAVDIVQAEVSSELNAENTIDKSFDGDVETCWQDGNHEEGDPGDGVGQVLEYELDHPCYIVGVAIINGRVKFNEYNYYENNRIQSMTVRYFLNDKEVASVLLKGLKDAYSREAEYYGLATDGRKDERYYCDKIQIVIDSVYKGNVYRDLCLTEIQFYEGIYEDEE